MGPPSFRPEEKQESSSRPPYQTFLDEILALDAAALAMPFTPLPCINAPKLSTSASHPSTTCSSPMVMDQWIASNVQKNRQQPLKWSRNSWIPTNAFEYPSRCRLFVSPLTPVCLPSFLFADLSKASNGCLPATNASFNIIPFKCKFFSESEPVPFHCRESSQVVLQFLVLFMFSPEAHHSVNAFRESMREKNYKIVHCRIWRKTEKLYSPK